MNIDISRQELTTVLLALSVCAPSGGGSAFYTVYRRLLDVTGAPAPADEAVIRAMRRVAQEVAQESDPA